jgi:hypothetical protein
LINKNFFLHSLSYLNEKKRKKKFLLLFAVQVLQPIARDIIDFMLEATTSENVAIGMFQSAPVEREFVTDAMTDADRVEMNRNSNNIEQHVSESNDCERHVVYHKFSISDERERVSFKWRFDDDPAAKFVNFR